jgi:hypothetical protein
MGATEREATSRSGFTVGRDLLPFAVSGFLAKIVFTCPVGYWAEGDKHASLPKVRHERRDVLEYRD